jgi:hypothetical protein
LTRLSKQLLSLVAAGALLAPAAFASSKESPHDTLMKSFQQANLWAGGPVKVSAKLRLPKAKPDGSDVTLDYTLSWAGPDKWRAEWTASGFDEVTVVNNGKLSYANTQPKPLVQLMQFEMAVAALDGFNPAGPYTLPPLDWDKAKMDSTKKKIGSVDAKCMAVGDPQETFCVDPANGHLLEMTMTVSGVDISSFEYTDYAAVGSNSYPQTVTINYAKTLLEDGKITVSRDEKFPDSLFAPPEKSTTTDFPTCPDVDKNYTAPHVTKSVPAKMPDAARKAKKYGLVWVMANVGSDGAVSKVTVIGGDPDLTAAATDAVQQYKWSPYMRCGKAAAFQQVVVVPFTPAQKLPEEGVLPSR